MWHDDSGLFRLMREKLFTAVVGDILDTLGFLHQFFPPSIQPLRDDMVVAGRAMTVLEQDWEERDIEPKTFGLMLAALDDLKPGEVYVASGGAPDYAMWGELMSTRARKLGAAGAVLNGCSRDTRAILAMNFPVFSTGRYAQDQRPRGRVVDFRVPLDIGQVHVGCGDIVFGDADGVVVIPRSVEMDVLRLALDKVSKENQVRTAIEHHSMSTVEAFAKFGVM